MTIPVRPGHEYHAWVHAVYPRNRWSRFKGGGFAVSDLRFVESPARFASLKVRERLERLWFQLKERGGREQPLVPVIVSPEANGLYPSTTTAMRLAWVPVPGAYAYHVRVRDLDDERARDERNNCSDSFLCLNYWKGAELEVPVRRGHIYAFHVHALSPGGKPGGLAGLSFYVDGPPAAPVPAALDAEPEVERELRRGDATLERLRQLTPRYAEVDLAELEDERAELYYNLEYTRLRLSKLGKERLPDSLLLRIEKWTESSQGYSNLDVPAWENAKSRHTAFARAPSLRSWFSRRDLAPPALLEPADGAVFPPGTTSVRLSWIPEPGADIYAVGVEDESDSMARDPRNDCAGDPWYYCGGYVEGAFLELPVVGGHRYRFTVRSRRLPYESSGVAGRGFSIAGQAAPPRKRGFDSSVADLRTRLDALEPYRVRLRALQRSYGYGGGKLLTERLILRAKIIHVHDLVDSLRLELKNRAYHDLGRALAGREDGDLTRRFAALAEIANREQAPFRDLVADEQAWRATSRPASRWPWALAGASLFAGAGLLRRGKPGRAPPVACAPLRPSDTQGRVLNGAYRIDRELGRGGMGVVYEAFDLNLKRTVAVKRMSLEAEEGVGHELFLKEAELVAGLKHPNIVSIFDAFEQGGRVYLVFEHVRGKTLGAPMALEKARRVIAQVCAALDYAHARKVIHRDLKPSNIMLGDDGIVKVMDFGIARLARHTVTRTQGWGTPAYMPPEQELGTVSKESDLYALGVCLYEMATGRLPFVGPDFLGQKQRMDYAKDGLSEGLARVVEKALAADPARRFHSAAEFKDALDALA